MGEISHPRAYARIQIYKYVLLSAGVGLVPLNSLKLRSACCISRIVTLATRVIVGITPKIYFIFMQSREKTMR
jgi:hypothetical protein